MAAAGHTAASGECAGVGQHQLGPVPPATPSSRPHNNRFRNLYTSSAPEAVQRLPPVRVSDIEDLSPAILSHANKPDEDTRYEMVSEWSFGDSAPLYELMSAAVDTLEDPGVF